MLTIYKKIEKSIDNPSGIFEIKNVEEITKPFLLCLSAQDNYDKSIYGSIREGARAARLYTTQEEAAGFKLDNFPLDFLGLRFKQDNIYQKNYEEIVDLFLFPFLVGLTKKFEDVKKRARMINFMTYCNGTVTYEGIEKRLEEKLVTIGLSKAEVVEIISQISLVAIGTMENTSNFKATTVTFIDVNDLEIATTITNDYKNILQEKKRKSFFGTLRNKNNVLYIYDGRGNHSLQEYFSDTTIVKPALCGVLTNFLENSIRNHYHTDFAEISFQDSLERLGKYGNEKIEPTVLLEALDSELYYGGADKYTSEEIKLKRQLYSTYRELRRTRDNLTLVKKDNERTKKLLSDLVNSIKGNIDEITFYEILTKAGMWQGRANENNHRKS